MRLTQPRREAIKRVRNQLRETRFGLALGTLNQPHLLALAYGSSDKWTHGYMRHYARHIGHLRFKRNLLLEIGVGGEAGFDQPEPGGSIRIWRDYLVRSTIVGIDIHHKNVNLGHRVQFHRADQSSAVDLRRVVNFAGVPNIVIDDGSHMGEHQVATFRFLFPMMPPGSVYAIEDLCASYYPDYGGGIPSPDTSATGLLRSMIDSVQSRDPYFKLYPELGPPPQPYFASVGAITIYPGIAFIDKV